MTTIEITRPKLCRIPTVKLKIPGKAFLKSESLNFQFHRRDPNVMIIPYNLYGNCFEMQYPDSNFSELALKSS